MRRAKVLMHSVPAGVFEEIDRGTAYRFTYQAGYDGEPISRTMPVRAAPYEFKGFPAFFDGLLPEGEMLDGLLRQHKIDSKDRFTQLLAVGGEMVGAVTVEVLQ
ncbi:HipA N-terminal domain-containing protein [Candidatus Eisenbacteria bacterium]|uniref:HipA N-terminal domain-containing protein n=1 Tax=Eiseniibacteriota bacterium TaxID=2212470 RepID=A0ABV6YIW4_UNCEI